jgi:MoaA/NifB/PqqE/SkfB family radical SAM enzyme
MSTRLELLRAGADFHCDDAIDYVHVYLTQLCNLECRHCYTDSSPRAEPALPLEFWSEVVRQLGALRVRTVHLEGGEPLTAPWLERLIERARAARIKELLVVTNGLLATRERLGRLRDAGLRKLAVSLDALDPAIHDALRPDSHARAWRAIEYAVALGLHTRVSTVLHRYNIGQVESFVRRLFELGAQTINLDWFNGAGRGQALTSEYQVGPADTALLAEFEAAVDRLVQDRVAAGRNLSIDLPEWYEQRGGPLANDTERTHLLACDAIRKQISINPRGLVYPCFIFAGGAGAFGDLTREPLAAVLGRRRGGCMPGHFWSCPIGVRRHIFYHAGSPR